jgi:predicted nucleic acid-binding Zn ribbon protein
MDQYNSIYNKKPKKKRVSDIAYYVIYALLLALILATFFFLYTVVGFEMSGKPM